MTLKFNGDSIIFSDNSSLSSASGIGGGSNIPEPSADGLFLVDGSDGENNAWRTSSFINSDNSIDIMLFQKAENNTRLTIGKVIGENLNGIEISPVSITFPDATTQTTAAGSIVAIQNSDMVWDYEGNLVSGILNLSEATNLPAFANGTILEGTLVLYGSSIGTHGFIHGLNGCDIIYSNEVNENKLSDNPGWQPNSGSIRYDFVVKTNGDTFELLLTPDINPSTVQPEDSLTFKAGSFIVLRQVASHNLIS